MTVQALFIDPEGIYPKLLGPENCWDEARDARKYPGTDPVVAHPPCGLWINLCAVNWARSTAPCQWCVRRGHPDDPVGCPHCMGTGLNEWNRRQIKPAWYPGGSDGGCFLSAYLSVIKYGGVLEHPAGSHAWGPAYDVSRPPEPGRWWSHNFGSSEPGQYREGYVCEVWQSAYGHKARKRTWLMYCGNKRPFDLRWHRPAGTHQVGCQDRRGKARNKPTLSKQESSATPIEFAQELIRLAEWSRA